MMQLAPLFRGLVITDILLPKSLLRISASGAALAVRPMTLFCVSTAASIHGMRHIPVKVRNTLNQR